MCPASHIGLALGHIFIINEFYRNKSAGDHGTAPRKILFFQLNSDYSSMLSYDTKNNEYKRAYYNR